MKISEILQEAPLPDDWDKSRFKDDTSFASRIKYAVEHAQRIGSGSSRVAFEMEYQGRPTVLKVAKNEKGMAQNDYEAGLLGDYMIDNLTIPMIDYDEENEDPTWLHVEKAEKMTIPKFREFFSGLTPKELTEVIIYGSGKYSNLQTHDPLAKFARSISQSQFEEKYASLLDEDGNFKDDIIYDLVNFVGNYDISPIEFTVKSNWGIYENRPVLVDLGGGIDVMLKLYGNQ